ncbi:MAG: PIN domain-containing protein [Chitinispirillia bacterium]|nr:PIN domain-containing protein [Chitinispirillia bacterium]
MNRYIADANIVRFYAFERGELTAEVLSILEDYGNQIYVPSKCVEELMHLWQRGKDAVKRWKSAEMIIDFIIDSGFGIKYVAEEHLRTLANLPLFQDHKDITDRVIIAQAITERIPVISCDRKFHYYENCGLNLVFNER